MRVDSWGRSVVGVALAMGLAVGVGGCRETTAVVVDVTTDLPCDQAKVVTTSFRVGHLNDYTTRPATAVTTRCDTATGTIGSLVLVPSAADDEEIAIEVTTATLNKATDTCATNLAGCIVARRVIRYSPHEIQSLPIAMRNVCAGVSCAATQTCLAGACIGAAEAVQVPTTPSPIHDAGSDVSTPVGTGGPPSPPGPPDASDCDAGGGKGHGKGDNKPPPGCN